MGNILKAVYDHWENGEPLSNGQPLDKNAYMPFHQKRNIGVYGIDEIPVSHIEPHSDTLYLYIIPGKDREYWNDDYNLFENISSDLIPHIQSGTVKILFDYAHDPTVPFLANCIDLICNYYQSYNVDLKNVIYLVGDDQQEVDNFYKDNNVDLTVIAMDDLVLQQVSDRMVRYNDDVGFKAAKFVCEDNINANNKRKHKFLSYNRTCKNHRWWLLDKAISNNWLEGNLFSFLFPDVHPGCYSNQLRAEELSALLPIEVDTHELDREQLAGFSTGGNSYEIFSQCYFQIVTETSFDKLFLSEKIYRPIQNCQPFVLLGPIGALAKLHEYGFRTFSPILDESYDLLTDEEQRFSIIEKEINRLNAMSMDEIHDLYHNKLLDICIHNQRHLATFENTQPYNKMFEKLIGIYNGN